MYLVTLGVQALRSAQRPAALVEAQRGDRDRGPGVLGVGYRAGLVTNLLNPKIGVFFVTFLPGFVPAGAPLGPTSLLLGVVFVAEGALYFTVLILLAERLTGVLRRPAVRRRIDRLAGVVLIGFGVRGSSPKADCSLLRRGRDGAGRAWLRKAPGGAGFLRWPIAGWLVLAAVCTGAFQAPKSSAS